jgi:phosphoglycerate dehydrogenase-like enzyme
MRPKVVCLRPQKDFDMLRVRIPDFLDIHYYPSCNEDEVVKAVADADFILASSLYPPITARLIAAAKALKLIQLCGSGYDTVDLDAANKAGVPVARSPGQNSKAVAEHALILMGLLNRRILESDMEIKRGNFQAVRERLVREEVLELEGVNLGIVGAGPIGKEMARMGAFFGARLYYYDIVRLRDAQEKEMGLTYVDFEELLRIADIVTLHVPLTEKTAKLIGKKELALMKPGAILINTSRGGVVDDLALIEALRANRLKGAALDNFDPEPIPAGHPFLSLEPELSRRLILTSHIAGATRQSVARMFQEAVNNLARAAQGEPPKYVVNSGELEDVIHEV